MTTKAKSHKIEMFEVVQKGQITGKVTGRFMDEDGTPKYLVKDIDTGEIKTMAEKGMRAVLMQPV